MRAVSVQYPDITRFTVIIQSSPIEAKRLDTNPYQLIPLPTDSALRPRWSLSSLFALAVGLPLAVDLTILVATNTVGRFFWLFEQAAPLLIVAWPMSLPISIWFFYALEATSNAGQLKSRQLLWLAPLIVVPMTMLVWGAVFAHPRGRGFAHWQLTVVHWAFFATIANCIIAVLFNRGRRSFVSASVMLLLLFSFSCSFIAGSSVTGDWL